MLNHQEIVFLSLYISEFKVKIYVEFEYITNNNIFFESYIKASHYAQSQCYQLNFNVG